MTRSGRRPLRLTERGKLVAAVVGTLAASFLFAALMWMLFPLPGAGQ